MLTVGNHSLKINWTVSHELQPLPLALLIPCVVAMPMQPFSADERERASRRAGVQLHKDRVLRPQTRSRRETLLHEFEAWLTEHESITLSQLLDGPTVNAEAVSDILATYGQALFYAGKPYGRYSETINAVAGRRPHIKRSLVSAWDVAFAWVTDEPHIHHPAMPLSIVLAFGGLALLWGWPVEASIFLMTWTGILRIGEVFQALRSDLVLPCDAAPGVRGAILQIRQPKTRGSAARHQAARIDPEDIVALLTAVLRKKPKHERLWVLSPSTCRLTTTTSTWCRWSTFISSMIVVRRGCPAMITVSDKIKKRPNQDVTFEVTKSPTKENKKKVCEKKGRKAGGQHLPFPLNCFSLLMLCCLCQCGAGTPVIHQVSFGNFSGIPVELCDLVAFSHTCPEGTRCWGDGAYAMAMTACYGDAKQQLQWAASGAAVAAQRHDGLQWSCVGFPTPHHGITELGDRGLVALGFGRGFLPPFSWGTIGLSFLWMFFEGIFGSKSGKRRKRKKKGQKPLSKTGKQRQGRRVGKCLWIARKRCRVKRRRYRILGRHKRWRLLKRLAKARFEPTRIRNITTQKPVSFWAKVVHWTCGYLGIRVGEAKHPGPDHTWNQNKRKASEANLQEPCSDSQLAQSLLAVLQDFQTKSRTQNKGNAQGPDPRAQANKKGKGGPTPKAAESKLARILMQTLQAALSNAWTDDEVSKRIISKITRHFPQEEGCDHAEWIDPKQHLGEKLYAKVRILDPERATKITGMFLEQSETEIRRLLESQKALKSAVQEAQQCLQKANLQSTPTWADKVRHGPRQTSDSSKGKGKTPGKAQGTKCAFAIKAEEWTEVPVLTSLPAIEKALTAGDSLPGNLVVTQNEQDVLQAKSIWNAFACDLSLTVAVAQTKAGQGPSLCVWWSSNKKQPPQRVQVVTHHIGSKHGPIPKTAIVTKIPKTAVEKHVTLRLLAPQCYRKHIPGVHGTDNPKTIISALASMTGCQASQLTGGQWHVAQHPHGDILLCHIKASQALADKLLPFSGQQALFITVVEKERKPVGWIPREKLPAEEYFRQCLTQAQKRHKPLALRQGGGSDLGLVDVPQTDLVSDFIRSWELFGAPRAWTDIDTKEFLQSNGWSRVEVINKFRRGPQFLWLFKASPAKPQEGESERNFWNYQNEDGSCHLTVALPRPRARPQVPTERLVAPKKRWVDTQPVQQTICPTQIDLTQDAPAATQTEDKERSPRRQKVENQGKGAQGEVSKRKSQRQEVDPQKAFSAQYPQLEFCQPWW